MNLTHYAEQPITLDRERTYEQHAPHSFGKPVGLWVSADGEDDWPAWCRSEEFAVDRLATAHEVTLDPWANVLTITTAAEILEFHETYTVQTAFDIRYEFPQRRWPIDWQWVATFYDGVVIAPYQWSARYDLDWYYGWDAASGCIWNLDAIASFAVPAAVSS